MELDEELYRSEENGNCSSSAVVPHMRPLRTFWRRSRDDARSAVCQSLLTPMLNRCEISYEVCERVRTLRDPVRIIGGIVSRLSYFL